LNIQGAVDLLQRLADHSNFSLFSLIMGETKLCKYRLRHNNVKLSLEVASTLTVRPIRRPQNGEHFIINTYLSTRGMILALITAFDQRDLQHPVRHGATTYALGRVTTFHGGFLSAWTLCFRKIFQSIFQLYVRPDMLARSNGAFGCLCGLVLFPFYLVGYVLKALVVFVDRLSTGIANGCCHKDILFVFDPSVQARVYSTSAEIDDILQFTRPGEKRVFDIDRAMQLALAANKMFKECDPCFPKEHWHWQVVKTEKLKEVLKRISGQSNLRLSDSEYATLRHRMERCDLEVISFSRFCLFIAEAVQARFAKVELAEVEDSLEKMTRENDQYSHFFTAIPIGSEENDDDSSDGEGGIASHFFRSGSFRRNIGHRMSLRTSIRNVLPFDNKKS
jgi:hypothetical protein